MTPELVDQQLAAMRAEGIKETIIFPRGDDPQLEPAFFSEGWFEIVGHTIAEAKRTGMHLWLFNDDYFPSGRAASLVLRGGQIGDRVYAPQPHLRPQKVESLPPQSVTGPATIKLQLDERRVAAGLVVKEGQLHADAEAGGGGGIALLNHGRDWKDYVVEYDLSVGRNAAGLLVRATDAGGGYLVDHGLDGTVNIYRQRDRELQLLASGKATIADPAAARRVRVRVTGTRIDASINGEHVVAATDDAWPAGTIGLRVVGNQIADLDNLRVIADSGELLHAKTFGDASALADLDASAFLPVPIEPDDIVAVAALPLRDGEADLSRVVDLTDHFRKGKAWEAPAGEFSLRYFRRSHLEMTGLYNNYLDLMHPEAVRRYLDAIHGEYERRFPEAFGTVIRGFWDDEPANAAEWGHVAWSDVMREELARQGHTPAEVLPAVFGDLGRAGRLRKAVYYRAVANALATYYRLSGEWAEARGVAMISNPYTDHFPPTGAMRWGDSYKNDQWFQVPGADAVFHQVSPKKRALTPRYPASSAHQLGRSRILAEVLGGYGWDLTPEVARFVNGYMALRGVNFTVLHAYWSDASKVIHPAPFQPENTWWKATDALVTWTGRVMEAGLGRGAARTAVLHPQRAAEAWYGTPAAEELDQAFLRVLEGLEEVQVDFDLLAEGNLDGDPHMRRQAVVESGALRIGPQAYEVVVVPPVRTLSLKTVERLRDLVRSGGTVVAMNTLPTEETAGHDVSLQAAVSELFGTSPAAPQPSRRQHGTGVAIFVSGAEALKLAVRDAGAPAAQLQPANAHVRVLRKQHGSDVVFLFMNEGEQPVETTATLPAAGTPELWNPDDGSVRVAPQFSSANDGRATALPLRLEPYQLAVVVFRKSAPPPDRVPHLIVSSLKARSVRAVEGDAMATQVEVAHPGTYRLVGVSHKKRYAGLVTIDDPLEPIPLDRGWRFRFDREGAEWIDASLRSWTETEPGCSGTGVYRRSVTLSPADLAVGRRLVLDLGEVRDVAEVIINGVPAGRMLWRPYRLDVTEALSPGDNEIVIRVTNTNGNARGIVRPSGLLGPVALRPWQVVNARLQWRDGE